MAHKCRASLSGNRGLPGSILWGRESSAPPPLPLSVRWEEGPCLFYFEHRESNIHVACTNKWLLMERLMGSFQNKALYTNSPFNMFSKSWCVPKVSPLEQSQWAVLTSESVNLTHDFSSRGCVVSHPVNSILMKRKAEFIFLSFFSLQASTHWIFNYLDSTTGHFLLAYFLYIKVQNMSDASHNLSSLTLGSFEHLCISLWT